MSRSQSRSQGRPQGRRRALSRLDVEALESRYALDATQALTSLVVVGPDLRPERVDVDIDFNRVAPARFESAALIQETTFSRPVEDLASPAVSLDAPTPLPLSITGLTINVDLGIDPRIGTRIDLPAASSLTDVPNHGGPAPSEPVPFELPSTRTLTSTNSSALELSSSNAIRAEEAATPLSSSRSDTAATTASGAGRHADSVAASALPVDRRADRPVPTAFATFLAVDAVRPADGNLGDSSRPAPSPGDLTAPRFLGPLSDTQGGLDSTSQRLPLDQARDAVFAGLFVDGFAPQLLDQAFRALKSVETNLESADGSGWYRMALGCWVVAAVLTYEAARQSQISTARSLRYVNASLEELEDER
jgi:hypothetical protein